MENFKNQIIAELILYILSKGTPLTQYYVYKILYFAERKHLAKWGVGILPGEFHAWEWGPVPKKIYTSVKHLKDGTRPIDKVLQGVISRADKDVGDYLIPLRKPDMDYISESEIEAIDASYAENVNLPFIALRDKSHDSAWEKAWANGNDEAMRSVDIAEAEGVSPGMLEYISENEAIRMSFE